MKGGDEKCLGTKGLPTGVDELYRAPCKASLYNQDVVCVTHVS